ncbi:hypothetical protein Y1Q_0007179 [Alligator mississippiensis]|uniref:Uncharacterized protein n=1 Tax=Alligator mississippiensis TaxID=8496 RepID=A0A151N5T5_ALLMI|nr:hypothetical protein Y1Q_0007179 [Alligator mississippiensis]
MKSAVTSLERTAGSQVHPSFASLQQKLGENGNRRRPNCHHPHAQRGCGAKGSCYCIPSSLWDQASPNRAKGWGTTPDVLMSARGNNCLQESKRSFSGATG